MADKGLRWLTSSSGIVDDDMTSNASKPWEISPEDPYGKLFTKRQLAAGMWTTRISSAIALVSALFVVLGAFKRRKMVFHQLILGMGIHLLIAEACKVVGPAAIPKDTTNALHNYGTIETCSVQGFLIYVSALTACLYYCSFSVYSYTGILCNFDESAIDSLKLVIHLCVHIYPLASGMYLLYGDLFNNTGFGYCFIETDPIGCGRNTGVPCERGIPVYHNNHRMMVEELFWYIPLWVALVGSTGVMITLYFKVRIGQNKILIPARSVALQSLYYLLLFYVGVIPSLFVETAWWVKELQFVTYHTLTLFANVMFTLTGVWMGLMYLYFSMESTKLPPTTDDGALDETSPPPSTDEFMNENRMTILGNQQFIFNENILDISNGSEQELEEEGPGLPPQTSNALKPLTTNTLRQHTTAKHRFSFNIFDGTNAGGAYADFIFDGDSDDERVDAAETRQWSSVQNRV